MQKPSSALRCRVGDTVEYGGGSLPLIAGPCVIESLEHCLRVGSFAQEVCGRLGVPFVFKASFDKANRSSGSSYRGPGLERGLEILGEVKRRLGVPVLSDVHEAGQAGACAEVLDVLQIPAFLCRQTDLVEACGRAAGGAGRTVAVKKGQFLSPQEMGNVAEKLVGVGLGRDRILLTERGTFFGYNRLVNDFGGLLELRGLGCCVVFDATHSCQRPGGLGSSSGGVRELSPVLARAACAVGVDGLFVEIHDDPERAQSDAATVMPLAWLEPTLRSCLAIRSSVLGG